MVSIFNVSEIVIWDSLVHSLALSSGIYSQTIEAKAVVGPANFDSIGIDSTTSRG